MYKKIALGILTISIPMLIKAEGIVLGIDLPSTKIGVTIPGIEVNIGSNLVNSYIGYRIGPFLPFMGLGVSQVSGNCEDYDEDWKKGGSRGWYKYHVHRSCYELSSLLCIPHIGGRFYIRDTGAKPYVSVSVLKVLPLNVDTKVRYERYNYDSLGNVTDSSVATYEYEEGEDFAKDLLGVFGFLVGFGAEYHFAPSFSVSGECGLNYYFTGGGYKKTNERTFYKYVDEINGSALLGLTYTRLQFNFHIGAKEK